MSAIWHQTPDPDYLNQHMATGTIAERLGILMTEVGDDFITGTMPADARTFQPYGVVHGGANVVLAETLGSTARWLRHRPKSLYVPRSGCQRHPPATRIVWAGYRNRSTGTPRQALARLADGAIRRCRQAELYLQTDSGDYRTQINSANR